MGDLGSIPGLRRSPGEGDGYPLQNSGLENSMDCIVHGVTKSQTRLSAFHFPLSKSPEHEHRDATTGNLITQGATKGQTANSGTCLGGTKWDPARFLQANRNGLQFKTNRVFFRRRRWHPTPVLLPGKSNGRRSLVGCSPWGR